MATMPDIEVFVTVGVDTHKDLHVAVALDQLGRWLDAIEIPTTSAGYAELLGWASDLGTIDRFGIEGTGSHGAGLCRWLTARGLVVVEVDRPDRRLRRNKGKSDTIDAESAARKVLSGEATAIPKAQDGNVEKIRILRLTRRFAVVAEGQASNQIHALIATAPDELRDLGRSDPMPSFPRTALGGLGMHGIATALPDAFIPNTIGTRYDFAAGCPWIHARCRRACARALLGTAVCRDHNHVARGATGSSRSIGVGWMRWR